MKKLLITLFVALASICASAQTRSYSQSLVDAADTGDAKAQYDLAECCFYGNGTAPDFDKALSYYQLAASGGNIDGKFKYAVLRLAQAGSSFDEDTMEDCMNMLLENSEHGHPKSSFFLAKAFYGEEEMDVFISRLKNKNLPAFIREEVNIVSDVEVPNNRTYTAPKAAEWLGLDGKYPDDLSGSFMQRLIDGVLQPADLPVEDLFHSPAYTMIEIVDDDEVIDRVDGVDDLTKSLVQEEVIIEELTLSDPMETIYTVANVQQPPMFTAGEAAMYKWISDNIQYPVAAAVEGIDGRVVVEIIVAKDGAVTNARVVRGRHPALDKEALRVVNAMPKWQPGMNDGQPVKVLYNLPVTFRLPKDQ